LVEILPEVFKTLAKEGLETRFGQKLLQFCPENGKRLL